MKEIKTLLEQPIFFEKNRVGRVYLGGKLFADFFGDDSQDCFEPEEWIVSSVAAINKVSKGPKEGVSKVRGEELYFDDLIREHQQEMLGNRTRFAVLTKALDSAIRLPAQSHPEKAFSRVHFGSDFGKAESWLVLATRPGAHIYFGFNQKMTKEKLSEVANASETDKHIWETIMNKVEVKPGDLYFVPAKMPHAIGPGCLMLEVQEPSDFTIQPEAWCADYHISEKEMYIGLKKEDALDCFDYDLYGDAAIAAGRKTPKLLSQTDGCKVEQLFGPEDTPCFGVVRTTLEKGASCKVNSAPCVVLVLEGAGTVTHKHGSEKLQKGSYFFLPVAAGEVTLESAGGMQFAQCLPPLE